MGSGMEHAIIIQIALEWKDIFALLIAAVGMGGPLLYGWWRPV